MNPALELNFWTRLMGILALEIIFVVALAFALQSLTQSAFWRRTIWQISFVCLLLLASAELTGVGRGVSIWLAGQPASKRTVSVRIVPTDEQFSVPSDAIEFPEPVFVPRKEAPAARSIWWPGILWLTGFGSIVARILFARVLFVVLRWRNQTIDDLTLLRCVSTLANRLGIHRKIHLLESSGLTSPVAFGIFRPSIGLPSGFAQNFTEAQQNAMLTHELAHLSARDPFWYLLADCAAAIFWWHPAIWVARRRLHSASEHAADEAAVILENGPGILAECLVNLGQQLSHTRSFGWLGVEGNGFRSHLGQRVERLLNLKETKRNKLRGWPLFFAKTAFTILFGGLIIFTSGWIQSGKEQEKNLPAAVQKSWNGSFASMTLAALAEEKTDSTSTKGNDTAATKAESIALGGLFDEDIFLKTRKATQTPEELMAEVKKILPGIVFYENELEKRPLNPAWSPMLMHPTMPPKSVRTLDELSAETKKVLPYFLSRELSQNKSTTHSNPVDPSKGRQAIKTKLDQIRFNEVRFDKVSLGEVLKVLRSESKRRDPENRGVNFLFNPNPDASVAPVNDPTGSRFVPTFPAVDLNDIIINISPALVDIRLADVLDSLVQTANTPIQYRIEDYAVVFSPKTTEVLQLYTRVFKVDSETFGRALDQVSTGNVTSTNRQQELNVKVRKFLGAAGVEFDALGNLKGRAVYFNDRSGTLMVRATLEDLERVSAALQTLIIEQSQITIEVKFVEINETANRKIDWHELLKETGAQMITNLDSGFKLPVGMSNWPKAFPNQNLSNSITQNFTTVLTRKQFRTLIKQLEGEGGTDILGCPKITTLSGRQAQVSVEDEMKVRPDRSANDVILRTGPVVDVIGHVSLDGFSIQIPVMATVKEIFQEARGVLRKKVSVPKIRQMSATGTIFDGQTLVLGEVTNEDNAGNRRVLFVFITATIIDPAGNRVNQEENVPFAENSIPKQPERK